MSYLERLIERATDSTLNLENNKIGSYKITCQHGSWVFVYNIHKNDRHLFSLDIGIRNVVIHYNKYICNSKEISDVHNVIHNLYMDTKEILIEQF